jgi:hypothetical protein
MGLFHNCVTTWLADHNKYGLPPYAYIAGAITYFCMYALRKPFSAAKYSGLRLGTIDLKILLVTVQILGYMISKFGGIIIISRLDKKYRGIYILICVTIAELALVLFGFVPNAVKPVCLFFNGLPLGLIWGLVFSFLEGRHTTEFLATGLCISFIWGSGIAKSVGQAFLDDDMSQFWMPAATGGVFFPGLIIGSYMLELLPEPSQEEEETRTVRVPMTNTDRIRLLKEFAPGVILMVVFYMVLQAVRDFRDNFAPELWNAFGFETTPGIYALSETIVGVAVFVPILLFMWLIADPLKTLIAYHILIFFGMLLIGILALAYGANKNKDTGMVLMVGSGIGLYIGYVPFNNIIMDLMLAAFKYVANSGFLMYICDALGYLSSVVVLMVRNFGEPDIQWDSFYVALCAVMAVVGLACMATSTVYYYWKYRQMREVVEDQEKDESETAKPKEDENQDPAENETPAEP